MPAQVIPCNVRRIRETDVPFVRATWIRSYFDSWVSKNPPRGISPSVYSLEHPDMVMRILLKSITIVACNPEDDDHVFGYICYQLTEKPIIHYVFVKGNYRGYGIGKRLLRCVLDETGDVPMWASHWRKDVSKKIPEGFDIEYNPYKAWIHNAYT